MFMDWMVGMVYDQTHFVVYIKYIKLFLHVSHASERKTSTWDSTRETSLNLI